MYKEENDHIWSQHGMDTSDRQCGCNQGAIWTDVQHGILVVFLAEQVVQSYFRITHSQHSYYKVSIELP